MRTTNIFLFLLFILLIGCSTVGDVTEKQEIIKCESIAERSAADLCYIREAVKEKDGKICLKISDEFARDVCYMQLAAWHNLPRYCDNVVIKKEKDLCFFGLAIQLSDLSLCDKIRKDTEIHTDQDVCKKVAAIKNTKENIREVNLLDDEKILDITYMTSAEVDK